MLYNISIKFQDKHYNSIVIAIRITAEPPTVRMKAAGATIAAINKITEEAAEAYFFVCAFVGKKLNLLEYSHVFHSNTVTY
jgi:hypothetical protein